MTDAAPASHPPGRLARRGRPISGILLFDKPVGWSSNFALQRVKRTFDARKAGHTGSLDPLASGMLPICLGEATKVSGFLLGSDKEYRVRMALGSRTATGDAEGPVVAHGPDRLSRSELERALAACSGRQLQVPPMHSALKHQGRRLYELARAGVEVDRPARPVEIRRLEIETYSDCQPILRVLCSKGTYIRTLVEDVAVAAGTVAHVAELRRLAVAPFTAGMMVTADELDQAASAGQDALDGLLLPLDEALGSLPRVDLDAGQARRVRQGQELGGVDPALSGPVRLYDPAGRFLGIGECLPGARLVPRRLVAA